MDYQVTLLCKTGQYKPVSAIVSSDVAIDTKDKVSRKSVVERGITKICKSTTTPSSKSASTTRRKSSVRRKNATSALKKRNMRRVSGKDQRVRLERAFCGRLIFAKGTNFNYSRFFRFFQVGILHKDPGLNFPFFVQYSGLTL